VVGIRSTGQPVLRERLGGPLQRRRGRLQVREVGEHAVLAVAVGLADGLVGDREDARAVLAGRLGEQLLEPQPEAGQRGGDQERQLVPAGPRERAQGHAQPDTGAGLTLVRVGEGRQPGVGRAPEQRARVHAHQRGRHDPERGQGAVAAADVGIAGEHPVKPALPGELLQARAGVGDRRVVAAVVDEREEVREQRQRLDRAPRLGRDDEQRPLGRDRRLHGTDRRRVGRVEHVQPQARRLRGEGAAQHLRSERGAAHPEQDRVGEAIRAKFAGEPLDVLQLAEHALGDRQPAEAVGHLGGARRGPQGGVAGAHPLGHALVLRAGELLAQRDRQRGWDVSLDGA
jgi:hypothetical protein